MIPTSSEVSYQVSPVTTRSQDRLNNVQPVPDQDDCAVTDNQDDLPEPRGQSYNQIPLEEQSEGSRSQISLEDQWNNAEAYDETLSRLKQAVRDGSQKFPTKLGVKVSISECELDELGRLLFHG
jgi:hypothetical protein